jgi:hypothetical protein
MFHASLMFYRKQEIKGEAEEWLTGPAPFASWPFFSFPSL